MKKILIALVTFAAAALAAGSLYAVAGDLVSNFRNDDRRVEGSGRIVTRTFDVGAFQGLKAFSCARVTLVKGSGPATVKIDDNLLPYLCLKVEKGTLRIGLKSEKGHFNNFRNVTLEVTVPCDGQIGELDGSGAAHLVAEPVITARELEIDASGASKIVAMVRCASCEIDASGVSLIEVGGTVSDTCEADASGASKIRMAVQCERCDMDASGSSRIQAEGSARTCSIEASGASHIDAEELRTEVCTAGASGASAIAVSCTRTLNATASGASSVRYKSPAGSDLSIHASSSGAGSIKRL